MTRSLVALLLVLLVTGRSWAAPCNVLLLDELPCEIQGGDPAPFTGTLMSKSTARSLADKVYEIKKLKIDVAALKLASSEIASTYETRISDLKIQLEDAPRPLLEQPFFWIAVGGTLIGGFAAGWALAN